MNVARIMKTWTHQPGYPLVHVHRGKNGIIHISQVIKNTNYTFTTLLSPYLYVETIQRWRRAVDRQRDDGHFGVLVGSDIVDRLRVSKIFTQRYASCRLAVSEEAFCRACGTEGL